MKMKVVPDEKYVLIMDEVNSLISHLRNEMSGFSQKRRAIVSKLQEFIRDMIHHNGITVFVNDYVPKNKCKVHEHTDHASMLRKLINAIESGVESGFVGSDSHTGFKAEVYDKVVKYFTDKKNDDIVARLKYFSSEDGDKTTEFCDPMQWKDQTCPKTI